APKGSRTTTPRGWPTGRSSRNGGEPRRARGPLAEFVGVDLQERGALRAVSKRAVGYQRVLSCQGASVAPELHASAPRRSGGHLTARIVAYTICGPPDLGSVGVTPMNSKHSTPLLSGSPRSMKATRSRLNLMM